ncbi:MAG: GMP/IMP nucleotidase [Steroidobacteraceae bacterium]
MRNTTFTPVDWRRVDTVLLDLDGTLLDLAYDNHFWRQRIPQLWAERHGLSLTEAQAQLRPRFAAHEGTLNWYCIEFWSRELGMDVARLKRDDPSRIRWLPGAREFLGRVRAQRRRLVLLTNAHPTTLAIKDEHAGVIRHFDAAYSSHQFGAPKENPQFWAALRQAEGVDVRRALFVDDSAPVLRAAIHAGVGQVVAVRKPDSSDAPRGHEEFVAVDGVAELL